MEESYKLRKSGIHSRGVFAAHDIKKGEVIFHFEGDLYNINDYPALAGLMKNDASFTGEEDRYVRVSESFFLGPYRDENKNNSDGPDDLANHSCDPNCLATSDNDLGLKLIARRDIKKGEELTYDYSTVLLFDPWIMKCNCGKKNCRKNIGEFRTLPPELQKQYIKEGGVPKYFLKYFNFDNE